MPTKTKIDVSSTKQVLKASGRASDLMMELHRELAATKKHPKAVTAALEAASAIIAFDDVYKLEEQVRSGEEARAALEARDAAR